MLVDVHAKTSLSEGVTLSVDQVIQSARAAGLDAIAFCETRNTARCQEVLEIAAKYDDIKVFIGVEIPTDRGILLGFTPDIGDFYLDEEWRILTDMTTPSPESVIEMFEKQNGVTIAARPYDLEIPFNMGDHIFALEGLKAVEVFNPRVGEIQHNFAIEAAASMALQTVGGSDPTNSTDPIGQFATFFKDDVTTQAEFVEALRTSEYWAVQIGDKKVKTSSRPDRPAPRPSTPRGPRETKDRPRGQRGDDKRPPRSDDKRGNGNRRR